MLQRYVLIFYLPKNFATFLRKFFAPIFLALSVHASTRAHTHAYARAYIYKTLYFGHIITRLRTHCKERTKNASFVRLQFLIKDFCKIIWRLGIKVITLQADTGNDQETTETNAANSIHAHGNNRNEARANSLFDFLDNC